MHRDSGQSRAEAIRSAIREIRVPLVGSTITPIVVFLPLISITGVTGVFFRALAVTVGMALLTSLALALTWTPTLSHYFLRSRGGGAPGGGHETVPAMADERLRTYAALCVGAPIGAGAIHDPADRRLVLLLYAHWVRPVTGDGRGRLHRRLHHARRFVAPGDEPGDQSRGTDSPQHAGGCEHLAPDGLATWLGHRHGSQHGRHQRQIETDGAVSIENFWFYFRRTVSDASRATR